MAVNLPFPYPDLSTNEWPAWAVLRNFQALSQRVDSVSAENTVTILRRDVGNPIKDIVNTTTETSLFATPLTIEAGLLDTNRRLRVSVLVDHLNNSGGTRTMTIRQKYGGQTLSTTVANITASATRFIGETIIVEMTELGATNVQGSRRASPGFTNEDVTSETLAYGSVDTTTSQTYDFTFQWGFAASTLSLRVYAITVEVS